MIEYKWESTLTCNLQCLLRDIHGSAKQGWIPQGGVFFHNDYAYQAMTREVPDPAQQHKEREE